MSRASDRMTRHEVVAFLNLFLRLCDSGFCMGDRFRALLQSLKVLLLENAGIFRRFPLLRCHVTALPSSDGGFHLLNSSPAVQVRRII